MKISGIALETFVEQDRQGQLLVLRSDTNLSGAGEIAASTEGEQTARSAVAVADLLVGRDPFDVEALLIDAKRTSDGTIADIALISAATSAMLDLAGQGLETSIGQLLGGHVRDRVRACAVGWADGVTGNRQLVAAARRTVASGYTVLRIEPFARSLSHSSRRDLAAAVELVHAVRVAVPDEVDLVVAGDCRLSVSAAEEFAHALSPLEPLWLEDPVPPLPKEPFQRLSERVNLPLTAGRGTRPDVLRRLVTSNLVDHLILEVGQVGGLIEARKIAALAEIYHIGIVPIASGGSISLHGALQLAAVVPNLSMVEVRPGLAVIHKGTVAVDARQTIPMTAAGISEVAS